MNAKMACRRGIAVILGCVALLGAGLGPVEAGVRLRESFEGPAQGREKMVGAEGTTPHGSGWRATVSEGGPEQDFQGTVIDLEKAGVHQTGGLPQGSVSLWIKRGETQEVESIFTLAGAEFDALAKARIMWEGWPEHDGEAMLVVESAGYPLWYLPVPADGVAGGMAPSYTFFLPKSIARGQWFNLTFTWGSSAANNAIYVDGVKVNAVPSKGFAMSRLLQDAAYLIVGAEVTWDKKEATVASLPGVNAPMMSLVDAIEIRDTLPTSFASVFVDPDALKIDAIEHDAFKSSGFSGKLVAGDSLGVQVNGTPGATATYDIAHFPDLDRKIDLDWSGWGVYLEDKVFFEADEVNLRDVEGYLVYSSTAPFDLAAPGMDPVEELDVKVQKFTIENLEVGTPYYFGVLAKMRDGTLKTVIASPMKLPLAESAPGVYTGTWTVSYQDRYPRAVLVGRLALGAQQVSLAGDAATAFAVDPALTLAVATEPAELKADEKSVSSVTVTVTDANGNPVAGHEVKFLLATTSQYTGVVGGGAFTEQVGGTIKESAFGQTDLSGKISTTYVAGFAAKTAVIVARDMASNSTGAGYVKTFIQAAASLELEPVENTAAMDAGYAITVTSSDEWLTADGKSQARITARVTLNNVPVEGHKVNFALAGAGSVRSVKDFTGKDGEARAVYTAGKKIGIALITATDVDAGISGSVSIELRSDAPAKIAIKLDKDKLPADGRSRAELLVQVTDINDNPNENSEVEYALVGGSGRLAEEKGLTDRRGKSANQYTAGRTPGTVTFEITVRSAVPTAEELIKARDLAVAVSDSRFF